MRINHLDLIRYGKFTDTPVELPLAERDFHVLIGPNEAGKSTIRSAILDLLYGIPPKTVHAFLHPMPDLRLGASVEHAGNILEFHRIKGNKQTLRTPSDGVLPDGVLGPFVGTTDRDFFSKMFGLDHARLREGGHSILNASDDLGQILFQSAAGIGSLGLVRKTLEEEADKLWSKRKSGDRAYYVAADELERATVALKNAIVRTKDWVEAQAKLVELEGAFTDAKKRYTAIKTRRSLLERVRRVAQHLSALDKINAQLAELGEAPELPESAAKTLADAEKESAIAQAEIDQYAKLEHEAQSALAGIQVDQRIGELSTEVTELNDRRLQYRAYEGDIARCQAEIDAQWSIVKGLAQQLSWKMDSEEAVKTQMPTLAARALLERLIRNHASLQQAAKTGERSEKSKSAEIARAKAELDELPASDIPTGLQAALSHAQKLGDFDVFRRERHAVVQQKKVAAEAAYAALGKWRLAPAPLRAMTVQSAEVIKLFVKEQASDDIEAKAAAARVQALDGQVKKLQLEIALFCEMHRPVTRQELLDARQERNVTWSLIKADSTALVAKADDYEKLVTHADSLADTRHDKVQQASELQSRQQQLQLLELDLDAVKADVQRFVTAAMERDLRWSVLSEEGGFPKISFQAAGQWLESRKIALDASDALTEANRLLAVHDAACEDARTMLGKELLGLGNPPGDEALAVLMLQADGIVKSIADARGQRRTLVKQIADAQQAILPLAEVAADAKSQFQQWHTSWAQGLTLAGFSQLDDVGLVGGNLDVVKQIETALSLMQKIRVERIGRMHAELEQHMEAARALAKRLAPDLADRTADDIALELAGRLNLANLAMLEAKRQRSAHDAARNKGQEATSRLQQAHAALAPLLARSGATTHAELAVAISRSERQRSARLSADSSEQAVREGGDGFSIEQLQTEADAVNLASLLTELDDLMAQDDELVTQLSELSAKKQAATVALALIGGSADAATAEGQRQDALAKMAATVERYLKVHTAARLLKWSIEQYREAKQGPMLSLASAIFSRLTLGSFERLSVDFDSEPLKLQGRRPNGTVVAVEGMSEGTRDQLFLSLRLAALDMHLDQAHVLPFIADDLFVNYDDRRSRAGLEALGELSRKTQVIFLSHHDHLLPLLHEVFGNSVNVVKLG